MELLLENLPALGGIGGVIAAIYMLWRRAGSSTTDDVISQRSIDMLQEKEDEAEAEADRHTAAADAAAADLAALREAGPDIAERDEPRADGDRFSELDDALRRKLERADHPD